MKYQTIEDIKRNTKETSQGCWEWQGSRNKSGYGYIKLKGKTQKVHRVVYKMAHPEEDVTKLVIRHTCDNPCCCNPLHLLSGTHADNSADKMLRGRFVPCKGEKHGGSKLLATDVFLIKYQRQGMTNRECAAEFHVSEFTVRDIRQGRYWKDI